MLISRYTSHILGGLTFMLIMLSSCSEMKDVAYSEFVALGSDGWDPITPIDFSPYPLDSVIAPGEKFDLILTLRYSPRNLAQAIPLEITEEDEEGVIGSERITVALCNAEGKPRGKRGIALYEVSDTLRRGFSLPEGYSLSVASLSPPSNTECLQSLGITLVRTMP